MPLFVSDASLQPIVGQESQMIASIANSSREHSSEVSTPGYRSVPQKRQLESSPFYNQFSEVEKAIANFTKHQPFNHHYAPNVNLNRSHNHHHHHHRNNNNNNNNRGHNVNHGHNNYNNGNNSNNSRLQPQTFTMNAQLKQQQQQQFLSTAAQQMRYKSGTSMNQMMNANNNVNNMAQIPIGNLGQVPMNSSMNSMSSINSMNSINCMGTMNVSNTTNPAVPSQLSQQNYIGLQYQQAASQQQQQQQQSMLGTTSGPYIASELKFDSFGQGQPQLSRPDNYSIPMRNPSPQFSAPVRPGSVGFGVPLEQIDSDSSFGVNDTMNSPLTASSGDYNKKLSLDESAYLGDIWGSSKGVRNSASVWA